MPLSHLTAEVTINRPLNDVVTFVDDESNDPLWQSSVLESTKSDDAPATVGTTYHVKEKFLGRIIEQDWVVTERSADGSHWSAHSTTGPFPMTTTMTMESISAEQTRVIHTLDIDVGKFFKIASPVVAVIAKKEITTDLEILKALLEE
ncbi:MAG: SRPBCC family protein [Mariprofundales bacterium]|nr:SRPBCC family protein [Mariprofundales bacterium]